MLTVGTFIKSYEQLQMNRAFRILILIFPLLPNLGNAQTLYEDLDKVALAKAPYSKFDSIWITYCQQYTYLDTIAVKANDTLNNLYKIYQDHFVPLFNDTSSLASRGDYYLIPQALKIGFVRKIKKKNDMPSIVSDDRNLVSYYFDLFNSYECSKKQRIRYSQIYNFRPRLPMDKQVYYVDTLLNNTLQRLYEAKSSDTLNSWALCYLYRLPKVCYLGGFDIGSAPHLDFVIFDRGMKKSIFYYKYLGEQHAMIIEKDKSDWIITFQELILVY